MLADNIMAAKMMSMFKCRSIFQFGGYRVAKVYLLKLAAIQQCTATPATCAAETA